MRGEPFQGTNFKQPRMLKVGKVRAQRKGKAVEDENMRDARARDGFCRFPRCGCRDFRIVLDVAHLKHRGMGGNPARDRTVPEKLILLCRARHTKLAVSIDRKTLVVQPLTKLGTAGPCAFMVDMRELVKSTAKTPRWFEVARETARHVFEPLTFEQETVLKTLKQMEI